MQQDEGGREAEAGRQLLSTGRLIPGEVADLEDIEAGAYRQVRAVSPEDMKRFQAYVGEMLAAFGMDLETAATRDTPARFVQALFDATSGYDGDPKLVRIFETECRGGPDCHSSQIVEGPIDFFSLCEHHALPFFGQAYVGYIAHEEIIGISKLTRLVRIFSRRFAVQERIGQLVADALEELLRPHGVAVYIEAEHLCTQMRGVREVSSRTRTSFWRGAYDEHPELRAEFFTAAGLQR
jgi:GTP cyclohydrolase I